MKQRESLVWFLGPTPKPLIWWLGSKEVRWTWPFVSWLWACARGQARLPYWPWSLGTAFFSPGNNKSASRPHSIHGFSWGQRLSGLWNGSLLSVGWEPPLDSLSPTPSSPLSHFQRRGGQLLDNSFSRSIPCVPHGCRSLSDWAEGLGHSIPSLFPGSGPGDWLPVMLSHHRLIIEDCTLDLDP